MDSINDYSDEGKLNIDKLSNEEILKVLNTPNEEIKDWNEYLEYAMRGCKATFNVLYDAGKCSDDSIICEIHFVQTALDHGATNLESEMLKRNNFFYSFHEDCDISSVYEEWMEKTCIDRYAEERAAVNAVINHYNGEFFDIGDVIVDLCEMTGSKEFLSHAFLYACEHTCRTFFTKLSDTMNLSKDSKLVRDALDLIKSKKNYDMEVILRERYKIGLNSCHYSNARYETFIKEAKDKGYVTALRRFFISALARGIRLNDNKKKKIQSCIDCAHIDSTESKEMSTILRSL